MEKYGPLWLAHNIGGLAFNGPDRNILRSEATRFLHGNDITHVIAPVSGTEVSCGRRCLC